ncbi:transposase [Nonomuraea fuscirosea]|nr:Tn3 family transposase [Nonomuraea fuscirosea]WSA56692.1 transposase [Nonomuraea fuscirosea]
MELQAPGRRGGVDALLEHQEVDLAPTKLRRQVQQVAQRAGGARQAGDDEGVAGPEVVQRLVELGASIDLPGGNSANKDIFYGKAGDLTGDDREHVEVSTLALHLVQAAIVYLNTRMVQIVLAEPKWRKKLSDADRRALSALFWSHLNLYGRFELDMSKQLDLGPGPAGQQSGDPL